MRVLRLSRSQLVVVWSLGLILAYLVYGFFGVWQEDNTAGQIAPLVILAVCLVLTFLRRRES